MNAYEKIITQMRSQGKYYNDPPIQIGTVGAGKKINLSDSDLDSDDYLIDCNLSFGAGSDKNTLKEGDLVVAVKIKRDETEQFVVLAKVVEP